MDFILVFLAGLLDRVRGDKWHIFNVRVFDKIAYSWVIAALCGFGFELNWFLAAFIALYATGMSFGWGTVLGSFIGNTPMQKHDLEWWQVGQMKTNTELALAGRGVLWALPVLPLALFDDRVIPAMLAIIIAFPMSLNLSVIVFNKEDDVWAKNELVRGWMNGVLVWIFINMQY